MARISSARERVCRGGNVGRSRLAPGNAGRANMTIAVIPSQGFAGAWVTCRNPLCLRSRPIGFEALGLAPETPFPAIAKARRLLCAAWDCGVGR